jgi:hypothetical protein
LLLPALAAEPPAAEEPALPAVLGVLPATLMVLPELPPTLGTPLLPPFTLAAGPGALSEPQFTNAAASKSVTIAVDAKRYVFSSLIRRFSGSGTV